LSQIGTWMAQLPGTPALSGGVPYAGGSLGDAVDFKAGYTTAVLNLISTDPKTAAFSSAQDLLSHFASRIKGASYDPVSGTLQYHVAFSQGLGNSTAPVTLNTDLGSLTGLMTTSSATLSPTVGGDFIVGLDLNSIGAGFVLTPATTLASLNGGHGVGRQASGLDDMQVTLSDGSSFN